MHPAAGERTTSGKWKSRMRKSASGSASFARLLQYGPRLWSPPTICTDFPFTVTQNRVVLEKHGAYVLDDRRVRRL